jgi:hypothetical protein
MVTSIQGYRMIDTRVTYLDLLKYEPPIVRRGDPSSTYAVEYAQFITQAKEILVSDVKSMGYKLRLLCTPLNLTLDTKSAIDNIERTRLIVDVTANSGSVTVTLRGTNDESNETWNTVDSFTVGTDLIPGEGEDPDTPATGATGEQTFVFDSVYKYYEITQTPLTTGTITFTSYLVERSFDLPLIYLSLYLLFKSKSKIANDDYYNKAEQYRLLYENIMKSNFFSYDEDESGDVEANEYSYKSVSIRR